MYVNLESNFRDCLRLMLSILASPAKTVQLELEAMHIPMRMPRIITLG